MKNFILALLACIPSLVFAEKIALTFDDLPVNGQLQAGSTEIDIVRRTLHILAAKQAPRAFGFVNAQKLESNPNGARALQLWVEGGQRVGNHSYSHINLNAHSLEEYGRDIVRNEPVLMLLSPDRSWQWFRYPYLREGDVLEKRVSVRAFLKEHGYAIAQTTIDYEDYLWNTPYARCADKRDQQAIARLRASYIAATTEALRTSRQQARQLFGRDVDHVLLLHLGAFTPDILPSLLALLDEQGFELATLEEVQTDPAYQSDPQYVSRRGGTLLQQHLIAKGIDSDPWPTLPRAMLDAICR